MGSDVKDKIDFELIGRDLYVNSKKVQKAWKNDYGWYWLGIERISDYSPKAENDSPLGGDEYWYGLDVFHDVLDLFKTKTGFIYNWMEISESLMKSCYPDVREIKPYNIPLNALRKYEPTKRHK